MKSGPCGRFFIMVARRAADGFRKAEQGEKDR
jgi:hypothetical protein